MNHQPNPNPQPGSHGGKPRERTRTEPGLAAQDFDRRGRGPAHPGRARRRSASCAACTPTRFWRERTYDLAAPTVTVAPAKPGAPADDLRAARQCDRLYRRADLRAHRRLPGPLVLRHRRAGEEGRTAGRPSTRPSWTSRWRRPSPTWPPRRPTPTTPRMQAERYSGLVKSDAVSQQDTDTYANQAAATASAVKSAQANLQRLKELQSFEKVYAPFDGVVTARDSRHRPVDQPGLRAPSSFTCRPSRPCACIRMCRRFTRRR